MRSLLFAAMLGLLFVPVANAAPAESQTLELVRSNENCESRIISYADWPKVQNLEWKLDLASNIGGRLLYFGADHSDDPESPQFKDIDRYWSEINPTVAYYEGPDRGVAALRTETIRQFGESGYLRFLAKGAGIQSKRLNPPPDQYLKYLLARFPPDQVSLFLLLGEAARLRERKGASLSDVEAGVKALIDKTSAIPGAESLIQDIPGLEAAYKRYWKEPADWRQAPQRWFTPGDDPRETGGIFTNAINRVSSESRDLHMIRVLSEAALKGERAFAVVGRNHVPMQAPALKCLLQKESSQVSVEIQSGVLSDGSLSPLWIEAIRDRHAATRLETIAANKRPLSAEEQRWRDFIAVQASDWSKQATDLARPFGDIQTPARVDLLFGNRGGDDGFTHSSATICLDLSQWVENYGEPADPTRVNRILSHEYTHLLTKSWLDRRGGSVKRDTPLNRALWELFYEGLGHYCSLSDKWLPKNGRLPDAAIKALRGLEPILVERLIKLKSASPNEEKMLTDGLSSGPFQKKWGALPVALWLALEADGDGTKLQRWIEAGPGGILDLAAKHLPKTLNERLSL